MDKRFPVVLFHWKQLADLAEEQPVICSQLFISIKRQNGRESLPWSIRKLPCFQKEQKNELENQSHKLAREEEDPYLEHD